MENKENMLSQDELNSQSKAERKAIYRDVFNRIDNLSKDDANEYTADEMKAILKQTQELITDGEVDEKINNMDEVIHDVNILVETCDILHKNIKQLPIIETIYSKAEFIKRLVVKFGNIPLKHENYIELLELSNKIIPSIPKFFSLFSKYDESYFSPQEIAPKPKRPTKEALGDKEKPDAIKTISKEEGNIDETVKFMINALKSEYRKNGHQPLDYFEFVICKDSFEETVENMFWVTFIINDSLAKLDIGEDGNLLLEPVKRETLDAARTEGKESTQMITSLSYQMWEERRHFVKVGIISKYRAKSK